jgi:hypothetical protein
MKMPIGSDLSALIEQAYCADQPVLLTGPHGIGKTATFDQAAASLRIDIIKLDMSLMEPPDLVGLPIIQDGRTTYATPGSLPTEGKGILALEELNRCARPLRNASLMLVRERRLNDYRLPNGYVPMATVNPANDAYLDADELDPALASRFMKIEVVADVRCWTSWARAVGVHPAVVAFVEQSPGAFESPEANPRSWEYVSSFLKSSEQNAPMNRDLLTAAVTGFVGPTWALSFMRHMAGDARLQIAAEDIINDYPAQRSVVRAWAKQGALDRIVSTLTTLQNFLRPAEVYKDICTAHPLAKKNIERFFSDLPADLQNQVRAWLRDRRFDDLHVPARRTR